MQIETYGQQMEVTPALRSYVETRFERLGRHFEGDCEIRVQLGLDKPDHKAEANVTLAGRKLHADAVGQEVLALVARAQASGIDADQAVSAALRDLEGTIRTLEG